MECSYCNNTFTTLNILKTHQKNAVYCKIIQKQRGIDVIDTSHTCSYCKRKFPAKHELSRHHGTCRAKQDHDLVFTYKTTIEHLETQNMHFKTQLKDVESRYKQDLAEKNKEISKLILKLENLAKTAIENTHSQSTKDPNPITIVEIEEEEPVEPKQEIQVYKLGYMEINDIVIEAREDGFINATELCKAGGKRFNNWYRSQETKEMIQALDSETGLLDSENPVARNRATGFVDVVQGGNVKKQGSWIHPDLAVQLAQWISPTFAIKVSRWIRELAFMGKVEMDKPKTDF